MMRMQFSRITGVTVKIAEPTLDPGESGVGDRNKLVIKYGWPCEPRLDAQMLITRVVAHDPLHVQAR